MSRINIAVDSGKYETKGMLAINNYDTSKDKSDHFRTCVSDAKRDVSSFGISNIEFEGKSYTVGEPQKNMVDPNSTKNTETHKICIHTAIARLLNGIATDNAEINVVIGCPLDIYTNNIKREEYLKNMLPLNKKFSVRIDGREITYTIRAAEVLPECSGIIHLEAREYRNEIVNVIDIGGLNVNGCEYQNLRPVITSIFTENLGGNTLNEDLREELATRGYEERGKLADNVIEDMLKKGKVRSLDDGEEIIRNIKRKKAEQIRKACEAKDWSLKAVDTKFIGGTSILLRNELSEVFNVRDDAFYSDPIFANVKGFLKMLRMKG